MAAPVGNSGEVSRLTFSQVEEEYSRLETIQHIRGNCIETVSCFFCPCTVPIMACVHAPESQLARDHARQNGGRYNSRWIEKVCCNDQGEGIEPATNRWQLVCLCWNTCISEEQFKTPETAYLTGPEAQRMEELRPRLSRLNS